MTGHGRSGADLIRATKTYASEDLGQTWRLYATTVAITALATAAAAHEAFGAWRWLAMVVAGLAHVRLFIFFHDAMHGAIFRRSRLGRALMHLYGYLIPAPPRIWKDSHNYHHAHTAQIVGASIGSFPLMTVGMHARAPRATRAVYRLARHPLTIALGYFTVFWAGMCIRPLFRRFRRNWTALIAIGAHGGLLVAVYLAGGADTLLYAALGPLCLASGIGSYLFYAQHNYPNVAIRDRREWEYTDAALHASTMMVCGPLMRWVTGDIGFHHVHHLNSQIPFYRLEEAMQNVPELQSPTRTSLGWRDVLASLRCALWDPERGRMITWQEVRRAR
jgi:omega-6 fatty acid desaturase (delta-12 desaturase)